MKRGLLLVILLAFANLLVCAQEVFYTGSMQYATGDYIFADRTHSGYLFNGLSVSANRFSADLSVPLIVQSSPWISYTGAGGLPSGGTQQGNVRRKGMGGQGPGGPIVLVDTTTYSEVGFGDPLAHLGVVLLHDQGARPGVRATVGIKVPLADVERGFGTGGWDVGGGVSISKALGRQFVFLDLAYWSLGDMEDLALRDPVSYSLAVGRFSRSRRVGVLASLSGYTEIIAGVDPPIQAGLGLSYFLDAEAGHALSGSASLGLTESTTDFSVSFGWRVGL